jgi:SSS family solute:Na+ symporter
MTSLDYAVLTGYFALMALIGFLCMRRIKVQEDYFLGGRGFGKLLQTFAAFGAGTGSSDPVNTGRTTFTSGMSGMWSVMYWLFVTPFYWITAIWYRRMRHTTLGDWFTERYESRLMGAAYAFFGIVFMMTYGSMMFSAIGKVAAPLVGPPPTAGTAPTLGIEYYLVPVIGVIVLIYGTAGGLRAAYWTDLVQGLCILLLSVLLLPNGLSALVAKSGDPATMGWFDGFRIMHEQIPPEFFSIVGTTGRSDFPLHFIAAVVVINLMTVVIQPHFIITGGGSAKNEHSARVGLVVGNFLKRFCTLGWVLTSLVALALFAESPELAQDPDKTWGVASRELLGSGLTGLMLACLLAALMSSIDVYMIVGSALVVRNVYVAFLNPQADEQQCLKIARLTGVVVVGGSVVMSLLMMDVFEQLKLTWIVLVPIAAPFWIGMYWRRATTAAAWTTIAFCAIVFFVAPWLAPRLLPDLRTSPVLNTITPVVETTTLRPAAPTDVARRQAAIGVWEEAQAQASKAAKLGPRPEPLAVGDLLPEVQRRGGTPIFWTGPVIAIDESGAVLPEVQPVPVGEPTQISDTTQRVVKRYDAEARLKGTGQLRLDFLPYRWLGVPLGELSDTTLATLDLPPKILAPFLVMIVASLMTRRNSEAALDRYYVKMKTPVRGSVDVDAAELALSYENPHRFDDRKLWPRSNWEFQRPTRADVVGFVLCVAACFAIIGGAVWIAQLQ